MFRARLLPNRMRASSSLMAGTVSPPRAKAPTNESGAPWGAFAARPVTPDRCVAEFAGHAIARAEGHAGIALLPARHGGSSAFQSGQGWAEYALGTRSCVAMALRHNCGTDSGIAEARNAADARCHLARAVRIAHPHPHQRGRRSLQFAQRFGSALKANTILGPHDHRVSIPGAVGFNVANPLPVTTLGDPSAALDVLKRPSPGLGWPLRGARWGALLVSARFGEFGLLPAWLRIDQRSATLSPVAGRSDRHGYGAIRVSVNLILGSCAANPVVDTADRVWYGPGRPHVPACARLKANDGSFDATGQRASRLRTFLYCVNRAASDGGRLP